jgi:two-component system sensor histidine kinase UhpB
VYLKDKNGTNKVIGSMSDITETRQLHDALVNAQLDFQKQITEATIIGQEKEKEEIGKELHDNINQILASVKLYLDTAAGNAAMKDELLIKSKEHIVHAINEIRKLSHSLIPPFVGEHKLLDAIKALIDEMNMVGLFKTYLQASNFDESKFDHNRKLMLYRIIQEQMNNIIKYSKAKEVFIVLKRVDNKLMLVITDDGVGFEKTKKGKGIGLRNIENRISFYSGALNIRSNVNEGTSLEIVLPV